MSGAPQPHEDEPAPPGAAEREGYSRPGDRSAPPACADATAHSDLTRARPSGYVESDPAALTPVERRGAYWLKRDDLLVVNGVSGGKVRTCLALARAGDAPPAGLVTAGSRASPQVNIVAHIAQHLGIPARCHIPTGELSPEVAMAAAAGAALVQHRAGYNNVIIARAREDARARGWREIPFGMECGEAVTQTRRQVQNIPPEVQRIVMPVGSGMSLAGLLWGLRDADRAALPVLGVVVGADPDRRLAAHAPRGWRAGCALVASPLDYHAEAPDAVLEGVALDPIYEAKCLPYLRAGDLLWVVGVRAAMPAAPRPRARARIGPQRRPGETSMTPRTSAAAAAAAPIATIAAVPELGEDGMMPPAAEWVHPGELVPWARNPRRNDGEPVAKVAASIAEFGFAAPIVARRATREIIAGHTRWKAAQQLGLERVPVRFVDLTEERAHLLALADNRLGELAEWDTAELAALLADYEAPDIEIAGWSAAELAKLEEAAESEGEEGAELGGSAEGASFRVYSIEAIADALVPALLGRTMADFAPPLPDVMAAINRCAAHASGGPLSRLTDRWFPQRYDVLAGKSPETPNQALQSEATIRGVATKLTMGSMGSWGEVRVALSHFGIYNGRQCARQFPIARARDIFLELSRPDARVLDPCAGWGGRLIGWMCALQGGSYRGIDASAEGCRGFARMIGELRVENAAVEHAAFEDVELEAEAYDFAFTSPPYFTLERYGTDPEQAEVRYPTYEAWRAGFLAVLIRNTLRALRPGAAFALVVSRAGDYDIPKDALECARAEGASVDSRSINIGGASTHKLQGRGDSEYEDLLVLRKPGTAAAKRGAA